jgi:hypothetical protein
VLRQVAQALDALAARRRPRERDVIADLDTRHVGTDRLDDSGTFVTEHGRAPRLCRPVDRIEVRMAHAARVESHEHLVPPRRRELELLDVVWAPGLLEDGRADLHAGACFCKRRTSSSGMWQRIK